MEVIFFELEDGGGIAIDAEEISALWSNKKPGTALIERINHDMIVVVGDYEKIATDLFDSVDFRPKKAKKKKADRAMRIVGLSRPDTTWKIKGL